MKNVGIDGTRGGWIAACISDDIVSIQFFSSISNLCAENEDADSIIIDIPIGLQESISDIRPDGELRSRLKGKTSSVFNTPCRQAVYTDDYESANAKNNEFLGKGLSKQSFAICNKIREVDKYLQCNPAWQNRLLESHTEYIFALLNSGNPVLENKKTYEGIKIRISLLRQHIHNLDNFLLMELILNPAMIRRFDDILDALCLAVIGMLGMSNGFLSIPHMPKADAKGLKMQIVLAETGV